MYFFLNGIQFNLVSLFFSLFHTMLLFLFFLSLAFSFFPFIIVSLSLFLYFLFIVISILIVYMHIILLLNQNDHVLFPEAAVLKRLGSDPGTEENRNGSSLTMAGSSRFRGIFNRRVQNHLKVFEICLCRLYSIFLLLVADIVAIKVL